MKEYAKTRFCLCLGMSLRINAVCQWPHVTWFSFDKFTYQVIFNGPRSSHCLGKRKNGSAGIWLGTISRADLILYASLLKLPYHGVSFFLAPPVLYCRHDILRGITHSIPSIHSHSPHILTNPLTNSKSVLTFPNNIYRHTCYCSSSVKQFE